MILAVALLHLSREGEKMPGEWVGLGAVAGSALAAWFRRSPRWLFQFAAGCWIGYVSGHYVRDTMEWMATRDYDLLAGTIAGILGYSALHLAIEAYPALLRAVKGRLAASAGVDPNANQEP